MPTTLPPVQNIGIVPAKRVTRLMSKALESAKKHQTLSPIENSAIVEVNRAYNEGAAVDGSDNNVPTNRAKISIRKPLDSVQERHTSSAIVPAKRDKRLLTAPCASVPAKRTKRCQSQSQNKSNSRNTDEDSVSSLIAMNCKLSNAILESKKQLYERSNALQKMSEKYFEKEVENITLKNLISVKVDQIQTLQKVIDEIKSQQFCTDLIRFDADSNIGISVAPVPVLSENVFSFDDGEPNDNTGTLEPQTADNGEDFHWSPTD